MERAGHYLMHIEWIQELKDKYPDCSHFVIQSGGNWRNKRAHLAYVLKESK